MSAVIMLFILTLIVFVQRGGWTTQPRQVDTRASLTAEGVICQQIRASGVFVALPWRGQANIVELQRWCFLTHLILQPYSSRQGWCMRAGPVTASGAQTCSCFSTFWWQTETTGHTVQSEHLGVCLWMSPLCARCQRRPVKLYFLGGGHFSPSTENKLSSCSLCTVSDVTVCRYNSPMKISGSLVPLWNYTSTLMYIAQTTFIY